MTRMRTPEWDRKVRRAIADRAAREEREAAEEAEGTAEHRRQAMAAADAEQLEGEQDRMRRRDTVIRNAERWEALSPQSAGQRIFQAGLQNDLRSCQVDITGMSLRSMMLLHSEMYG